MPLSPVPRVPWRGAGDPGACVSPRSPGVKGLRVLICAFKMETRRQGRAGPLAVPTPCAWHCRRRDADLHPGGPGGESPVAKPPRGADRGLAGGAFPIAPGFLASHLADGGHCSKQPRGRRQGAAGDRGSARPGLVQARWGAKGRRRRRAVSPGSRFSGRLVWLPAGRSPGSCQAGGEAPARARRGESVHGKQGGREGRREEAPGVCTAQPGRSCAAGAGAGIAQARESQTRLGAKDGFEDAIRSAPPSGA